MEHMEAEDCRIVLSGEPEALFAKLCEALARLWEERERQGGGAE